MAEKRSSSIDEIKVFFGTIIFYFTWSFAVSRKIIRDCVRNFIENKAFLPCNIQ